MGLSSQEGWLDRPIKSTWWHPSTSHLFEAIHGKTKLLWITKLLHGRDFKKGLHATSLEATLQHHYADNDPISLKLDGNLTLTPSGVEVGWLLDSPSSELKWEVYSKYAAPAKGAASLPAEVTYVSIIHHKEKPFGAYRLQVRSSTEPCLTWELRHNITSEPWLYTSNVSYACDPLTHGTDVAKAHMDLTVLSESPLWKLLNVDLKPLLGPEQAGNDALMKPGSVPLMQNPHHEQSNQVEPWYAQLLATRQEQPPQEHDQLGR
ncbi:hypothetical protein HPB51_005117 [Rhipicephalus microplus]|uniref:Uncharacterized protein n=1 Tax=Rhipicephalus microplus TaxID=6941 RepID=A0A9J6ELS2_RHIMP|nr:hypothetical protein HPB51_005117 [Rhipicephalus microplus]